MVPYTSQSHKDHIPQYAHLYVCMYALTDISQIMKRQNSLSTHPHVEKFPITMKFKTIAKAI